MKGKLSFLAVLMLVVCVVWAVPAGAGETAEATSPAEKAMKLKVVEERQDAASSYYDFSNQELVIEPVQGHVEITYEEVYLEAGMARFSQRDDRAVLTKGVKVIQDDVTITGGKLTALFAEEQYTVENNARFEQNDGEEKPLIVTADRLEIAGGQSDLHAVGSVRVEDGERIATADELFYKDAEQLLELIGDVHIQSEENGMVVSGQKVVIDLETDKMTIYGPWEAQVEVEE